MPSDVMFSSSVKCFQSKNLHSFVNYMIYHGSFNGSFVNHFWNLIEGLCDYNNNHHCIKKCVSELFNVSHQKSNCFSFI